MTQDFHEVLEVARLMASFPADWFVAGGWAVDLFLGRKTRDHSDVDIAVSRADQGGIHSLLRGWTIEKVVPKDGALVREPWPLGEWLSLPVHELHARSPSGRQQEFLLQERDGDTWVFRRNPSVRRPWDELTLASPLGLRFMAPEVVLLFKAKDSRDRDVWDFMAVLPELGVASRTWLREALEIWEPGHPWLAQLSRSGGHSGLRTLGVPHADS